MSNVIKTIFRLLPVTLVGLFLNLTLIKQSNIELMTDDIMIVFVVVIFIIAFLWTLSRDSKAYMQTSLKLSFIPSVVGAIFILSFFVTNSVLAARDKSPILLQAGYDGGFNGAWFEFREDGTYKFGNSGGIGATYSRGKYLLKDSLITLDKESIHNTIQSKFLVIKKEEIMDTLEQVIYQINQENQIIDKDFKFIIHVDKRNK